MAKLGDEDMEAAGVEEGVVAPEFEEDVADEYDLALVQAEPLQNFSLSMGE